jgi:hypothetical protein
MPTKSSSRSRSRSNSRRRSHKKSHRRRRVGGSHFYTALAVEGDRYKVIQTLSENELLNNRIEESVMGTLPDGNRLSFKEYLDNDTPNLFKIENKKLSIMRVDKSYDMYELYDENGALLGQFKIMKHDQ